MAKHRDSRGRDSRGRWVKGQSGNAGGRPRGSVSLTALLRAALAETDGKAKKVKARLVIDVLIAEALGGNLRAVEAILDRIDGPASRTVIDNGVMEDIETLREHLSDDA